MTTVNCTQKLVSGVLSAALALTGLLVLPTESYATGYGYGKHYYKHYKRHSKKADHKELCMKVEPSPKWEPLSSDAASPHANVKTYDIVLSDPPNDTFVHDNMGGIPAGIALETLHAAEGTMYIVEHPDGRTDISFDLYHLLPNGVYSLWDVINTDVGGPGFADQPLADVLPVDFGDSARPDFFGGIQGMGAHGLRADACGRAKFTINLTTHRPNKWFLLDFHGNDWVKGGTKGVNVIPAVLWAEFPAFDQ